MRSFLQRKTLRSSTNGSPRVANFAFALERDSVAIIALAIVSELVSALETQAFPPRHAQSAEAR